VTWYTRAHFRTRHSIRHRVAEHVVVSYTDVIDMEYDPIVCTQQKACTCKWQFVVDTHIFLPFEEEDVKMVI
jgi:hypothetical protein